MEPKTAWSSNSPLLPSRRIAAAGVEGGFLRGLDAPTVARLALAAIRHVLVVTRGVRARVTGVEEVSESYEECERPANTRGRMKNDEDDR